MREGLEGNLCRCTGYHNIVKAVRQGAAAMGKQEATMGASDQGVIGASVTPQGGLSVPDRRRVSTPTT